MNAKARRCAAAPAVMPTPSSSSLRGVLKRQRTMLGRLLREVRRRMTELGETTSQQLTRSGD